MKKLFLLFIIFVIILSCQESSIIKENEKIKNKNIILTIYDNSKNIILYHVYFKNINDSKESFAVNNFDLTDDIKTSLFPGIYNLYIYGLIDKDENSKMVFSYSIINNLEIYENKNIKLDLTQLDPDVLVEYDNIKNKVYLKIYMNELGGIFSISSLSLKQGNDRFRSLDIQKENNFYFTEVPLIENGDWFMNISYLLYDSKKRSDVLIKDNISISTSYFKDIFLGEFNLL